MLRQDRLLAGFARQAQQVRGLLAAGASHVWAYGPPGAGRRSIHRWLAEHVPDAVAVELPPFDNLDAVAHGLYQASSHLDAGLRRELLTDEAEPAATQNPNERLRGLRRRARRCAEALAGDGKTLIVSVPDSWLLERVTSASARERSLRADAVLRSWLSCASLRTVVISGVRFQLARLEQVEEVPLQVPSVDAATLRAAGLTDRYADATTMLAHTLATTGERISPIHARVAIGCLALGADHHAVISSLRKWVALERLLVDRLVRAPDILRGLRRLACARVDIPRDVAIALSEVPAEHAPFVTECVGFGDAFVRINELVRGTLARAFEQAQVPSARVDAHAQLAEHYRSLDRATDGAEAAPDKVIPWLEKVHHLAHMGPDGADEWATQALASRELYWDRARSLSYEHHDYDGAAAVYRRCITELGPDAYSLHYLGFNLHRTGTDAKTAADCYREAVRLDPINPWWNGRLVTFLIDRAQYNAASREWQDAIERVDFDGQLVRRDSWLARHLHRWIVEAWLMAGRVRDARDAFDLIPRTIVEDDEALQRLEQRLLDAEQTVALGESVYPAQTPLEVRFARPRVLPDRNEAGHALERWYPGRVVEASTDVVRIVYATPDEDPSLRRVIQVDVGAAEWKDKARSTPQDAHGFIEIGEYADRSVRIENANLELASWADDDAEQRASYYLRAWYAA